jgi:hypothetical protein
MALCRFTAACCPSQKIDEYTPDAWGLLLEDVRFDDAKEAVVKVARKQPWVSPAEIIAEVKKIRAKRIDEYGPIIPPADLDPIETVAWLKEARRVVGDGGSVPERGELKPRDMKQLTAVLKSPAAEICYNDGPPHPRTECHVDRCGLNPEVIR